MHPAVRQRAVLAQVLPVVAGDDDERVHLQSRPVYGIQKVPHQAVRAPQLPIVERAVDAEFLIRPLAGPPGRLSPDRSHIRGRISLEESRVHLRRRVGLVGR